MKESDGFDARRLRPRTRRNWRLRIGALLGALLLIGGVLLALAGVLALAGLGDALGDLGAGRDTGIVLLIIGLLLAWLGRILWRRCRRKLRAPDGLSMSPHLMKKRG